VLRAPAGTARALVIVRGRLVAAARVRQRTVRLRLVYRPGRFDLRVRFVRPGRRPRRNVARAVWLLPAGEQAERRARRRDARLEAALGRLGRPFDGYAGIWVHDLRTGRSAGWNADASFPAASTVKLGVLLASLRRFGPRPERSPAWSDVRNLVLWSSNLASNRLLRRLGGSEWAGARIAEEALHHCGARSSTFTGDYRLGTAYDARALDLPRPPPFVSYRRTTARDLGRVLFELHAAALGNRLSLRRTGLTRHEARLGLALLLSSVPTGLNTGLLRPALGRGVPLAQKHGWTSQVWHTAAIVYGRRGPKIVVVLTYRPVVHYAASAALGARVARLIR
jgi:Beta-lactamase enzyme family